MYIRVHRLRRALRGELELPQAAEQRDLVDVVGLEGRELVGVGGEHVGRHAVRAPGGEAGDQRPFEGVHLPSEGARLRAQEQNSAVAPFEFGRICANELLIYHREFILREFLRS